MSAAEPGNTTFTRIEAWINPTTSLEHLLLHELKVAQGEVETLRAAQATAENQNEFVLKWAAQAEVDNAKLRSRITELEHECDGYIAGTASLVGVHEEGLRILNAQMREIEQRAARASARAARLSNECRIYQATCETYEVEQQRLEQECATVRERVETAELLLLEHFDMEECRYDHHDHCQAHGLSHRPCLNQRTLAWLTALRAVLAPRQEERHE